MSSLNRVILIGRLVANPESRQTTTGKNLTEFRIAVDKRFKQDDGATADFFRVKAWGNTADFVNNYLSKGRLVAVDGRIEHRQWTDKDGNKRETYEIVAESVQGLDKPRDGDGGGGGGGYRSTPQRDEPPVGNFPSDPPSTSGADEYDPFADE